MGNQPVKNPKTVEVDARKIAKRITVNVRIKHEREMIVRQKIGLWLARFAVAIMGSGIAISTEYPSVKRVRRGKV